MSQPESRVVLAQIERYKPSRIVTYHEPLACVDYDGEGAEAIAQAMGEHTDLPADLRRELTCLKLSLVGLPPEAAHK